MQMEKEARISNYEIAKQRVQAEFHTYDHEAVSKKLNIKYTGSDLYINFLNDDYRINCQSGMVFSGTPCNEKEAGYNEVMSIYDILCYSKDGAFASGKYKPLLSFANIHNSSSYAGSGMMKKDEMLFDNRDDELSKALESLGGVRYGKGDVSYKLPLCAELDLYLVFSFWNSDEDFPAQINFMFDENIISFMHYETLWFTMGFVLEKIRDITENKNE